MATIISSKTTGGGGLSVIGDSSGILQLASADGTTAITVDASQNVGIGTTAPGFLLDVRKTNAGANTRARVANFSTTAGSSADFLLAAGIANSYVNMVALLNSTGTITFGADLTAGIIQTVGASPLLFNTNATEKMRIDTAGNVTVSTPGGLGYGTGSGGTVTQVTSKSTTVTLNKPTGQITMSNAALASAATISFSVSNSLVTATDTIVINNAAGGTQAVNYITVIGAVAAGSFQVVVKNNSAGSLSEAVVLNFAIIKGVIS